MTTNAFNKKPEGGLFPNIPYPPPPPPPERHGGAVCNCKACKGRLPMFVGRLDIGDRLVLEQGRIELLRPEGKPSFTREEQEVMDLLVMAHNKFLLLDVQHDSDIPEWVSHFHVLQMILSMRILQRLNPETFPIKVKSERIEE